MSNYNSTHTGAELDEAIGRVIDGGSIKVQVDTNTTDIADLKGRMTTAGGNITTMQVTVAGHTKEIEMARLASGTYAIVNGSIKNGGGWATKPATSLFIPIVEDATIVVNWSPNATLYSFSFLSALDLVTGDYTYADGYTGWISHSGSYASQTFTAPNDAKFFYLAHNYDDVTSITVNGIEIYSKEPSYRLIDAQESVKDLTESALRITDLSFEIGTNMASQALVEDFLISNAGGRSSSTTWKSVTIHLDGLAVGTQLTFGGFHLGRSGYYAFYGNGAKVSNGSYSDPVGNTNPVTVTIPSGADTLYFDVKSGSSTTPTGWDTPYEELMCNKGATLLPFVPYAEVVTAIKGYPLAGQVSGGGGGGDIIVDLPTSADGSDIQTGYAYINSSTGIVTVKL